MITSIAVNETGLRLHRPDGHPHRRQPDAGLEATAVASGGVDNVTLTDRRQRLHDPADREVRAARPARRHAGDRRRRRWTPTAWSPRSRSSMPGSGYTTAPTVTILDGDQVNATAATAEATIGIGQIDVTSGGQGYDSAPTVDDHRHGRRRRQGRQRDRDRRGQGRRHRHHRHQPRRRLPDARAEEVRRHPAGPRPGRRRTTSASTSRSRSPTRPPTPAPTTTRSRSSSTGRSSIATCRRRCCAATSSSPRASCPGNQVALSNANLDPAVADTPITGFTGVDNPHYLGPTIVATKDKPVADPVPQPAADRCRRRPVPARRHLADGLRAPART